MWFIIKPFYERWWGKKIYLVNKFSRSLQSVWVTDDNGKDKCIPVAIGTVRPVFSLSKEMKCGGYGSSSLPRW